MKDGGVNQAGLFSETSFEDILKDRQFVTQEKKEISRKMHWVLVFWTVKLA